MRGATPTSIEMSRISSALRPSGRFLSTAIRVRIVSFSSLSKASWTAWRRSTASVSSPSAPKASKTSSSTFLVASWRSSLSSTWVAVVERVAELVLDLAEELLVDLRDLDLGLLLAGLLLQLALRLAELLDLAVGDVERVEDLGLGHLVGAGLDHQDGLLRARDDQVEVALEERLLLGVDDERAVLVLADADSADRHRERDVRHHERGARAVHGEDVVGVDVVDRHRDRHELRLAPPALGEERADRAVDHPRGQRALLAGTALALEEAAGDLARGVHALLDVDGQGEEVDVPEVSCGGRGEDHRVPRLDDHGAAGLLGQLAGLERNLVPPDLYGDPAYITIH